MLQGLAHGGDGAGRNEEDLEFVDWRLASQDRPLQRDRQSPALGRHQFGGSGDAISILFDADDRDSLALQPLVRHPGGLRRIEAGEFVRRCGGDIAEGQQMLAKGERITPQKIALLAAQGVGELNVGGEVRAVLIATGDELAALGTNLEPGQIYDSNSALLRALLARCGVKVVSIVHLRRRR